MSNGPWSSNKKKKKAKSIDTDQPARLRRLISVDTCLQMYSATFSQSIIRITFVIKQLFIIKFQSNFVPLILTHSPQNRVFMGDVHANV